MGDDITIGVTEIVNNIEVTAQPNDQIVDISVIDNTDEVTLNITPTVIEINVNKGSSYAKWGTILGTLSDQEDLQDALDLKADLVDGKVPSSQLPSYVDDVIEVANYAALPAVGESGKIYITLDDNHIFRWTGSTYVEITDNTAVWGAITGTLSSQTDLQSALNLKANDNAVVHLTGNESISGQKTFANTIYAIGGTGSGEYAIEIDKSFEGEAIRVKNASSTTFTLSLGGTVTASSYVKSGGTSSQFLKADGSVDSTSYQTSLGYTPANDSAVVHIEGVETVNGIKTFSNSTKFDYGINLKQDTTTAYFPNYTTIDGYNNGYIVNNGDARAAIFYLANNVSRVYNFPDANGTFALTSDLSSAISGTTNYVPKFTSSNALGNSLIYDNGTNVFVGGSGSNGNRFTVVEGGTTLVGQQILMQNASSSNDALNIVHSGTGKLIKGTKGVEVFNITNSGGAYFAGNVGIGTTNSTGQSSDNRALQIYGAGFANRAQIHFVNANTGEGTSDGTFIGIDSGKDFYVNNTEGATIFENSGSERMRITSGGNVGIGTNNPLKKLHILGSNGSETAQIKVKNPSFGVCGYFGAFAEATYITSGGTFDSGWSIDGTNGVSSIELQTSNGGSSITFGTASSNTSPTERMRISSGGNVGIGTQGTTYSRGMLTLRSSSSVPANLLLVNRNNNKTWLVGVDVNTVDDGGFIIQDDTLSIPRFVITSGGDVLVGTTTNPGSGNYKAAIVTGGYDGLYVSQDLSAGGHAIRANRNGDGPVIYISRSGTNVGSISVSGSSTAYNTSSDYRLKKDLFPIENALERLKQLKPVNFAWKSNGERVDGFIAHELAEVVPEAVTGEKDAAEEVEVTPAVLDEEGNVIEEAVFETVDVYQGIDQSKIVPLLVAAMQEQNKVLEQLKSEIELLKQK